MMIEVRADEKENDKQQIKEADEMNCLALISREWR
jgi:hypothetical protein